MASFTIQFLNHDNKLVEEISVVGKKVQGDNDYEHYHIAKPNEYGIKWVLIGKDGKPNDICTIRSEKDLPHHHKIRILKQ